MQTMRVIQFICVAAVLINGASQLVRAWFTDDQARAERLRIYGTVLLIFALTMLG
jgi:hypothetical protein